MGKAVTVRGHLADSRHVELDEPVTNLVGPLEVVLRSAVLGATKESATRSILGLGAHLGKAPSAEEIDDARREIWASFPRDDIA